jgi:hypothetical protein
MDYGFDGDRPGATVPSLWSAKQYTAIPIIIPDTLNRVFSYVIIYKWFMCISPVAGRIPGNVGGWSKNV